MSRARQARRLAARFPELCGPSEAYRDRLRSLRISADHAEIALRTRFGEELSVEEHDAIWSHVDPPDTLGAVLSFARAYPWPWQEQIRCPEYAAARVVEGLEPLLPDVRRLMLAALTTSARNHAGGAP